MVALFPHPPQLCCRFCVGVCVRAHVLGQEEGAVAASRLDRGTEPLDRTKFLKKLFLEK